MNRRAGSRIRPGCSFYWLQIFPTTAIAARIALVERTYLPDVTEAGIAQRHVPKPKRREAQFRPFDTESARRHVLQEALKQQSFSSRIGAAQLLMGREQNIKAICFNGARFRTRHSGEGASSGGMALNAMEPNTPLRHPPGPFPFPWPPRRHSSRPTCGDSGLLCGLMGCLPHIEEVKINQTLKRCR